jgi:hypothetical protein
MEGMDCTPAIPLWAMILGCAVGWVLGSLLGKILSALVGMLQDYRDGWTER